MGALDHLNPGLGFDLFNNRIFVRKKIRIFSTPFLQIKPSFTGYNRLVINYIHRDESPCSGGVVARRPLVEEGADYLLHAFRRTGVFVLGDKCLAAVAGQGN